MYHNDLIRCDVYNRVRQSYSNFVINNFDLSDKRMIFQSLNILFDYRYIYLVHATHYTVNVSSGNGT